MKRLGKKGSNKRIYAPVIRRKNWFILAGLLVIIAGIGIYWLFKHDDKVVVTPATNVVNQASPKPTASPVLSTTPTPTQTPVPTDSWPVQLTLEEAASITVVVNKKHQLPANYVPNGGSLRTETQNSLNSLFAGATNAGYNLKIISGYRSYANQQSTYNGWVNQYGQSYADTISARAGFSEHQTGLAVDVGDTNNSSCDLESCFGDLNAGKWLAANAPTYGFIIRYPSGKDTETGYQYEPWHIRYIGVPLAQQVTDSSKTLDEYFGIPAGDYQ